MNVFTLTSEWLALDQIIDDHGGELNDPATEAAFVALGEALQHDTAAKFEGMLHFIRRKETDAAAAKAEAEQYLMMARVAENAAKRAKELAKWFLESTGQKSVKTTTGRTFAIQANGGQLPISWADSIDPASLPPEFQKVRIEIDKDRTRAELEAGEQLSFARLDERGAHLRIK